MCSQNLPPDTSSWPTSTTVLQEFTDAYSYYSYINKSTAPFLNAVLVRALERPCVHQSIRQFYHVRPTFQDMSYFAAMLMYRAFLAL